MANVRYITDVQGWCSANPNKWVAEERLLNDEFNIAEAKFTYKRIKRMYLYLVYLNQIKHEIFKYKYPRFSNLCFFLSVLLILLYDPTYILCNLMLVIIFAFGVTNPWLRRRVEPVMRAYFFRDDLMNPYSRLNVKSLNEFEDENVMRKVYSKKKKSLKSEEAKKAKKLKKKEGIYTSLKRSYLSVLQLFIQASDLLEKLKKYCRM